MGGRKLILPTSPVQPSQSASGGHKLIDDRSLNESCIETKKDTATTNRTPSSAWLEDRYSCRPALSPNATRS